MSSFSFDLIKATRYARPVGYVHISTLCPCQLICGFDLAVFLMHSIKVYIPQITIPHVDGAILFSFYKSCLPHRQTDCSNFRFLAQLLMPTGCNGYLSDHHWSYCASEQRKPSMTYHEWASYQKAGLAGNTYKKRTCPAETRGIGFFM